MADERVACTSVILVLCGIPACGKTYLANFLKHQSKCSENVDMHIVHICYDDLIPCNLTFDQNQTLDGNDRNSPWKHYRTLIIKCVEKLLPQYKKIDVDSNVTSTVLPSFHEFWQHFLVQSARQESACCCTKTEKSVNNYHVFLIDDNMYYRSMRHKYFLLARKYSIGFAQVFISCSKEKALKRNKERGNPVGQDIIMTMANRIEAPMPDRFPWELNNLTINADEVGSPSCLEHLQLLIRKALANPVQPLTEEVLEMKEESRAINLANAIHQTDQALRKLVTKRMLQAQDQGCTRQQMRSLAEALNSKRKTFLDVLKKSTGGNDVNKADTQSTYNKTVQKLINKCCELCSNKTMSSSLSLFLTLHKEILTNLQNKEQFQTAIQMIFEHFIKE